jgi:DNA-binding NarL/FixJ family response regulator
MDVIKVLVADAHALLRTGMVSLIHQQVDFEVVGEAQDGVEAVETATALSPDLILMDIHLLEMDGLEAARQIKEVLPHVTLVLLTGSEMDADLWEAIRVGADGYLSKQIDPQGLCRALRGVMRGEAAISRATCTKLFEEFTRLHRNGAGKRCPHKELSPREQEVLQSLTTGAGNKETRHQRAHREEPFETHPVEAPAGEPGAGRILRAQLPMLPIRLGRAERKL